MLLEKHFAKVVTFFSLSLISFINIAFKICILQTQFYEDFVLFAIRFGKFFPACPPKNKLCYDLISLYIRILNMLLIP